MDKRLETFLSEQWECKIRDKLHYFLDDLQHNPVIPEDEWKIDTKQRVAIVGDTAFTLGTSGLKIVPSCPRCKKPDLWGQSDDLLHSWEIWGSYFYYAGELCEQCREPLTYVYP